MFSITTLMILIPALPLAATLLTAALGPRVLKTASHWPVVLAIAGSCILSLGLLHRVGRLPAEAADRTDAATESADHVGYDVVLPVWRWATVSDAQPAPTSKLPHTSSDEASSDASSNAASDSTSVDLAIEVTLRADALTAIMLVMVTFISTLVAIYSIGYMGDDPGYARFFTYIGLFVFSMTMLVSVSNFVLLYVFWEAVGVCSYLLIGFWYQKPSASAAGKKAFLVNRVGDFGFALGIFLLWTTYGTLNFHDTNVAGIDVAGIFGQSRLGMAHSAAYVGGGIGTAICLLLMLGACGKSAQFPLHIWLPDAMEGPTPVSALIHAATMVTAGVYMVARCTPLFFASVDAQHVVAFIGAFTALLAGLIAMTQTDLKRVLAYSTVSQLGYMFLALGMGSTIGVIAGMFHLFTHAFFKALLFLGSGSVMHAMGGVIDMRQFGGLRKIMPITCLTFFLGCLALAGIPPFSGFWSKDMILAAVQERAHELHGSASGTYFQVLFWVATFTAFLTAFYTFRAFLKTFFGQERIPPEAGDHAHESPWSMTVPLMILAVFAVCIGGILELTHWFVDFLSQTPSLAFKELTETTQPSMHADIAAISSIVGLVAVSLATYFYLGESTQIDRIARWMGPMYHASRLKFLCDEIYDWLIVRPLQWLAGLSYLLDRYLVDGLVNAVGWIPKGLGRLLRRSQSGLLQSYALAMAVGVLILLATLVFWPARGGGTENGGVENGSEQPQSQLDSPGDNRVTKRMDH